MPKGNTLTRLLIASLTAAAVAAPAATAQPIDPTGPAKAAASNQELRGEATKDQSTATSPSQELRTEAAKDQSRAPVTKQLPGPPTWPMHPRAIAPTQTTVADGGDGGGVEAPVMALIIAGGLALCGGLTVAALRHRTRVAH